MVPFYPAFQGIHRVSRIGDSYAAYVLPVLAVVFIGDLIAHRVDERLEDFTPVTNIKGEINREGIRKMTPREWARLQGYPDDFVLPLADTHLYKQLGNSVSVPVIRAIAEKIKEALDEREGVDGQ